MILENSCICLRNVLFYHFEFYLRHFLPDYGEINTNIEKTWISSMLFGYCC